MSKSAIVELGEFFEGPAGWLLVIGGASLLVVYLVKQLGKGAATVASAVTNVNAGTPYEGTGVIGTLGHATDALSGGVLSEVGSNLGSWLYDTFHPPGDTTAGNIPTSNATAETSDSMQSAASRPYTNGPNATYVDSWENSPIDPSYAGTALQADTSSWND